MELESIIRQIAHCNDTKILVRISRKAEERKKILNKRIYQGKVVEAWDRARGWKAGQVVYCCAKGTFLGGPLQRGDELVVEHVQLRAKRLWVKIKEKSYWFGPKGIHRYEIYIDPPEKSLPESEKRLVNSMAKVAETLTK